MFPDSATYIGGLAREFLILHLGSNWFDKSYPTNLPDSKVCHLKISPLNSSGQPWALLDLPSNICCVIVKYLPFGALKSYLIKNRRKKLAFKVVVQITLDMARGLSYLHSEKIVHRDVKTENMLLDKSTVKIVDFGVACVEASNPNDMTGETGTLGYMALRFSMAIHTIENVMFTVLAYVWGRSIVVTCHILISASQK